MVHDSQAIQWDVILQVMPKCMGRRADESGHGYTAETKD